jgi:hypothetical protein
MYSCTHSFPVWNCNILKFMLELSPALLCRTTCYIQEQMLQYLTCGMCIHEITQRSERLLIIQIKYSDGHESSMGKLCRKNMICTFLKCVFEFTNIHTRCEGCCVQIQLVYSYMHSEIYKF